ncbi:MAG: transposase [Candidatus Uhrbacteria bacterium]|nr:transposase [Candidatus Uhrbacteria bacterium]
MAKKKGTRQLAHSFIQGTSVTRPDVAEFLFQYIQPKSDLFTDGAGIYRGIDRWWPVTHQRDIHKKWEFGKTSEIEGMFGCLRTFIRRMYHHVTMEHLPEVVAEFCARFSHPEMFNSPVTYLQKTIHTVPLD